MYTPVFQRIFTGLFFFFFFFFFLFAGLTFLTSLSHTGFNGSKVEQCCLWSGHSLLSPPVTEHEKEEEPKVQIEEGIPVDIKPREKWRQNLQDRLEEESQDSLDEYGGDTAYFAEDGSFVGDLKQGCNTDSVYDEIPEPAV